MGGHVCAARINIGNKRYTVTLIWSVGSVQVLQLRYATKVYITANCLNRKCKKKHNKCSILDISSNFIRLNV